MKTLFILTLAVVCFALFYSSGKTKKNPHAAFDKHLKAKLPGMICSSKAKKSSSSSSSSSSNKGVRTSCAFWDKNMNIAGMTVALVGLTVAYWVLYWLGSMCGDGYFASVFSFARTLIFCASCFFFAIMLARWGSVKAGKANLCVEYATRGTELLSSSLSAPAVLSPMVTKVATDNGLTQVDFLYVGFALIGVASLAQSLGWLGSSAVKILETGALMSYIVMDSGLLDNEMRNALWSQGPFAEAIEALGFVVICLVLALVCLILVLSFPLSSLLAYSILLHSSVILGWELGVAIGLKPCMCLWWALSFGVSLYSFLPWARNVSSLSWIGLILVKAGLVALRFHPFFSSHHSLFFLSLVWLSIMPLISK